jgi:hypothetical protein
MTLIVQKLEMELESLLYSLIFETDCNFGCNIHRIFSHIGFKNNIINSVFHLC